MSTPPALRLPPELDELIFDHLSHEKGTLKACSLVCRAWLFLARKHLFEAVRFEYPGWEITPPQPKPSAWKKIRGRFRRKLRRDSASTTPITSGKMPIARSWVDFLRVDKASNNVLRYTKKLWFIVPLQKSTIGPPVGFISELFQRRPGLRSLYVESFNSYNATSSTLLNVTNLAAHISSLRLTSVNFPSIGNLMGFLSSMIQCSILVMTGVTWDSDDSSFLQQQLSPPPIRKIELTSTDVRPFYTWLQVKQALSVIEAVAISHHTTENSEYENDLLSHCTSLRTLSIYTCEPCFPSIAGESSTFAKSTKLMPSSDVGLYKLYKRGDNNT
ncbi:hypothetical protein PIIN_09843 [Serendipita indica DSM 11827]|uniref:F-box domain-containing protein n=1 Tax=Serendipita indica (strain DSM 11827) TaxID=1109443 RepID=G4U2K9_SERID|nr:hypothetical protein PIIN_09843 [Serendipita indica DSM 11827]